MRDEIKEESDSSEDLSEVSKDDFMDIFCDDKEAFESYAKPIIRLEYVVLGAPGGSSSKIEHNALGIYNKIKDIIEEDRGAP